MASKNFLKQLRVLDKKKPPLPYASATWWHACVVDDDADDILEDDEEGESWLILEDGTLDACLDAINDWISMEVDQEFTADGSASRLSVKYDDAPQKYIAAWERRQQQRREEIRQCCLAEGCYEQKGQWLISSVLTPEQVAYEAKRRGGFS